ncbi:hypothetical protein MMC11_005758 [Xylographa trunciseda]|nr:hypothetical protein [Xylographa trunciseda]
MASGINTLPVELIRQIFDCLPVRDVKRLRLTCTKPALIGTEYLSLSEVHLIYTWNSFTRLREISLHPFFRRHVKSIYYEGDRLCFLDSLDAWRSYVTYVEDTLVASKPKDPASQGSQSKFVAAWRSDRKLSYTDQEMKAGWENYQACYKEQKHIEDSQMDFREIVGAISRFPRLETVKLSIGHRNSCPSNYLKQSFAKTLIIPKEQFAIFRHERPGLRQYVSLMMGLITPDRISTHSLGLSTIGLRPVLGLTEHSADLRVLHLDAISWHVLRAADPFVCSLTRAIRRLQNLRLVLKLEPETTDIEAEKCRENLESGSLFCLLTSATDLESLHFGFDTLYSDQQPARLADIFGKQRWGSLREVALGQIQTTEDDLLAFLKRHKATLKVILIQNMRLEYSVAWIETLRKIKNIAQWDSALVCGKLYYGQQNTSEDNFQYDIGIEGSWDENQCAVVRDYLTRKSQVLRLY